MTTHTLTRSHKSLGTALKYHLSESWTKAIGILRNTPIDPARYQKQIRKAWGARMKRQMKIAGYGD